jgi:hypothetical protein
LRGKRRSLRCRRVLLTVVFVIPAAFAVKSARASFYKVQPILCDGIDDGVPASIFCTLPEETRKESFSTKRSPHAPGKVSCPAACRSRVTAVSAQKKTSFAGLTVRSKRLLAQRTGSADDPDPH